MSTYTVNAYPETCTVTVHKTGKSTYTATGIFMGRQLTTTGRSEASAVNTWKEVAESRYRCS